MAKDHALRLGKLVGSFQSLECLLRFYLRGVATNAAATHLGRPYFELQAGELVPIDDVANYDSLGQLLSKYNEDVARRDPALRVDASIVNTRDLLAHGR